MSDFDVLWYWPTGAQILLDKVSYRFKIWLILLHSLLYHIAWTMQLSFVIRSRQVSGRFRLCHALSQTRAEMVAIHVRASRAQEVMESNALEKQGVDNLTQQLHSGRKCTSINLTCLIHVQEALSNLDKRW
jgi:hypothetical protein